MDSIKFGIFVLLVFIYFYVSYPNLRNYPDETVLVAIFKILPIVTLLVTVAETPEVDIVHAQQMKYFKYGLIFSLLGDIFMNWPNDYSLEAMGLFVIAHLFYIKAFGWKPRGYESALFCFTSGFVSFMFLLPGIKGRMLQTAVFMHCALIMATWWRTIARWQHFPSLVNLLGVAGSLSFAVSDFIIGLDTWKFPKRVPYAMVMIMATYYLAQLLLTISIVNYRRTFFYEEDLRVEKKG